MDTKVQLRNSEQNKPDYERIFRELAEKGNIPAEQHKQLFSRKSWSNLDVIQVNEQLFGNKKNNESIAFNQKHKAYDEESIIRILAYQRRHGLSNAQIAKMFKLSRNTIAKWHRIFPGQNIKI